MVIHITPRITPKDLEKILKYLPEPTYVEISLFGGFDYSSIFTQAEELIPCIKLKESGRQAFRLKNPSTENILDIYRRSYESEKELENEPKRSQKRVDLDKACWYLDNHGQIELTPWEINIKYNGQEPKYISQMRRELSGINVRIGIEINK